MQMIRRTILIALCCIALPLVAQDNPDDEQYIRQVHLELQKQLQHFTDDYEQLYEAGCHPLRLSDKNLQSGYYIRVMENQVKMMNRNLQSLEVRWNAFTTANLPSMADSDTLMEMMTHTEMLRQAITDTIQAQTQRCQAVRDYYDAEHFILAQDSTYAKLYKQARALSLVQKLSPQLEKIKAQEQVRFEQIQTAYDKSRAATEVMPQLNKRAAYLNEHYYATKAMSEKIQAMEYKPLIQRIKDYLLGLACVAVILIFVNMIKTKIDAAKKAREAVKQQMELLHNNSQTNYPTI